VAGSSSAPSLEHGRQIPTKLITFLITELHSDLCGNAHSQSLCVTTQSQTYYKI
jgi:hypothetical protein